MSKEIDRIYLLAKKVQNNTISDTELDEFNAWYNSFDDQSIDYIEKDEELKERILVSVMRRIKLFKKHKQTWLIKLPAISAAASLLIFFTWSFFQGFSKIPSAQAHKVVVVKNDATPGIDRAILTLSNGDKLDLCKVKPGLIATEGNFQVFKSRDNIITYKPLNETEKGFIRTSLYNLVTIPKGGKYQTVLPDGSHVWLNANSSLRFPINFGTRERRVEMSGEGYFEVAKDKRKVFRVATHNQVIEVLGTHFNVKSYSDEPVCKVTLLEGSVRIISGTAKISKLLKPGQQAEISSKTSNIAVQDVDTAPAVAWKSGYFEFDHANIESLMSQLSRWYNVDVVYQGPVSNEYYEGKISRNVNLSEVLKILESGGVNFKIEGKKLIVLTEQ